MDSNQISFLIAQLNSLSEKLSNEDQSARKEALKLSKKLTVVLEQPENVAVDLAFSPFIAVAARIAVNLNLFRLIIDNGGPVTSKELESLSGGEELLIVRTLRPMASIGFVEEVGERTWKANAVTEAMAKEEIAAGHRMVGEMLVGAAHKSTKYLEEAGYRCPVDPHDGFLQYAYQTKLNVFQYFNTLPDVLKDFNLFMGNTMGARDYWVDWFPIEERLLMGATPAKDSALLVDVGAGKGHDLMAFRKRYPRQEGRLILQDLAPVINSIRDIDSAIECMIYDFFTGQPVTGARAYFYHHILHDWSDDICLDILKQVSMAMKPGYSKLLLHEMIIPERGASTFHAMLDMTMMAFNSGMERSENQWRALLDKAGFVVLKVWPPAQEDADGIVEATLRE